MSVATAARKAAFDILYNIEQNREYSNIGLDKMLSEYNGEQRDRAFITNLVSGVCERRITLDYNIKSHLSSPKTRLKPNVRTALRMGAYEILFCDGVPARASVNEYVGLIKSEGAVYASGMVNAVLRKIASQGLVLPPTDSPRFLSVKYSFPEQTVRLLSDIFHENTSRFLEYSVGKPKIYGRVNTVKTDFDSLKRSLLAEHIEIEKSDILENAFYFVGSAAFMKTAAFNRGLFHIQDLSSQLCCEALAPNKGDKVIDVCASPGGKTFTAAEIMTDSGEVVSCDIYKHKIGLIKQGAERLGLSSVKPLLRDAAEAESKAVFDRVLCDVPCSGFGVIRKKAEIKYRNANDIKALAELQAKILDNSASLVKAGGRLVYSTCTVTYEENEAVVEKFLKSHKEFSLDTECAVPGAVFGANGYRLNGFELDCDSFFFAPLIRRD